MSSEFIIRNTLAEADIAIVQCWLSEQSYWAMDVPYEVVAKSIENSLPFAIYESETGALAGFARVITDRATFAYLCDVFVLPEFRGQGLSKYLMETIVAHPDLQKLRRFLLMTRDAHSLYDQFGFQSVTDPAPYMSRHNPNPYRSDTAE